MEPASPASTSAADRSVPNGVFFPMCRRFFAYCAISLLLGVAGAIAFDLDLSGLGTRTEIFLVLVSAPILMGIIFVMEFRSLGRKDKFWFISVIGVFLWPIASGVLVFVGWQVAERQLPDTARVYYWLRQPYIEANWKTDPKTGTIYFPIRYMQLEDKSKRIPNSSLSLIKVAPSRSCGSLRSMMAT